MEIETDWDGIEYTNNSAARLIMKNGDVWFRTRRELKQIVRVVGFEFKFEDVAGIDFVKVTTPMEYCCPCVTLHSKDFHPYVNVEEINLKGIAYFPCNPETDISDFFPKLKKISFDDELKGLDLRNFMNNLDLQKIGFPQHYYQCACRYENEKFPKEWSKDMQFDIVAHYPKLVSALSYMPEKDCEKLYDAVCEEAIKRAGMRIESAPKKYVIRAEAENLYAVQEWIKECKVEHDDVEKSLTDVANTNGFEFKKEK